MANIQFRSTDAELLPSVSAQLNRDLQQAGLAQDLQIYPLQSQSQSQSQSITRGDPVTWATIAMAAVGSGGALSVLVGKEGLEQLGLSPDKP